MANPIKTSEILQDDNLDALIAKIKALEGVIESLTGAIKKQQAEAGELEISTKKLTATTSAGRDETVKNAKAADDIEKAYKQYEKAISDTNKEIQHYRAEANIANQIKKNEAKLAANVATSYNALSAQYSLIKIRLNAMSKAEREATEEGKALVKRSKEIHDEMKRLQAETGNTALNVGNYTESVRDAINSSKLFSGELGFLAKIQNVYQNAVGATTRAKVAMTGATGGTTSALKAFRIALISTGIGAIVVVLGTLIAAFASTQEGVDALNRVLVPLKAIFEGLWGAIQNLSLRGFEGLKKAVKDPIGAIKSLGDTIQSYLIDKLAAFGRLGQSIGRIMSGDVKEGFKDLFQAAKDINPLTDVAKALQKVADETGEVIKKNMEMGKAINNMRVSLREEEIAFETRRKTLERTIAAERELASNQLASASERQAALGRVLAAQDKLAKGEQSIARQRVKIAKAEASLSNTSADARMEIARLEGELIQTETNNLNERRRIVQQLTGLKKQEQESAERMGIEELEQNKAFQLAKLKAERDYNNESLSEKNRHDLQYFIKEQDLSTAILTEKRRLNKITQIELDTALLEQKAAFDKFVAGLKTSYWESANAIRRAVESGLNPDGQNVFLAPLQSASDAAMQSKIKAMGNKIGESAAKAVAEGFGESATNFEKLLQGGSIYEMMGIDISDEGKEQVKGSFDFAKTQLTDFMNFRAQIAARNVANADREVQAAENALNREIQLQAAGLANNADTRQKDLSDAQRNREKALKEQEKAQRAQQRLQTVEQATNLVTAIAKVFSSVPFPLNIAASALMLGAFVSAKTQAASLARREFSEGDYTVLEGGSHASGNDIFVGQGKDGRPEYAEGGEARMILSKKSTRKYRSVLPEIFQALKQGTFENEFSRQANAARDLPLIVNASSHVSTTGIETGIGRLIEQGKEKTYTDGKGRTVIQRGNRTTVYR